MEALSLYVSVLSLVVSSIVHNDLNTMLAWLLFDNKLSN